MRETLFSLPNNETTFGTSSPPNPNPRHGRKNRGSRGRKKKDHETTVPSSSSSLSSSLYSEDGIGKGTLIHLEPNQGRDLTKPREYQRVPWILDQQKDT